MGSHGGQTTFFQRLMASFEVRAWLLLHSSSAPRAAGASAGRAAPKCRFGFLPEPFTAQRMVAVCRLSNLIDDRRIEICTKKSAVCR